MTGDEDHSTGPSGASRSPASLSEQRLARPKRREKVTGEELEARFEGWKLERRQQVDQRTPEQKARRFRRVIAAGLGAVAVALVAVYTIGDEHYTAASAAGSQQIEDLEVKIAGAEAPRDDEARIEALTKLSEDSAQAAHEVADAQQAFAGLIRAADASEAVGGVPSKEMTAVAEHRRVLDPYFEDSALVLKGKEAYQWSTAQTQDADQIDPRFSWYVRYDGEIASKPSAATWEVASAMPVVDEEGIAHVTWTYTESGSGEVLAFASADYSAESGKFSSLEVGVTAAGGEHERQADRAADEDEPAELTGDEDE